MAGPSSEIARQTWEIENDVNTIPASDEIFRYDEDEQKQFLAARKLKHRIIAKVFDILIELLNNRIFVCTGPWDKDPHYFKDVQISALALLKMVMHARSGGSLEIMGLLLGKVVENTMVGYG